jgi:hypothetical protein
VLEPWTHEHEGASLADARIARVDARTSVSKHSTGRAAVLELHRATGAPRARRVL